MRKVRILRGVSFLDQQHNEGAEVPEDEIPGGILQRLIDAGSAEYVGDEELPEWPLVTSPEDYLETKPDGPKADLARKILGIA